MKYDISVDLSELQNVTRQVSEVIAARLTHAVAATAQSVQTSWQNEVQQAKLWAGEKAPYIESIKWKPQGPFAAVVYSEYPLAHEIEVGRPRKDLKAVLPTARKARQVKSGPHAGQKYLIIPFRHNTPTASGQGALARQMPADIYQQAKALAPSRLLPAGSVKPRTRRSATGHLVPQHSYRWGDRLPSGLAPKLKPQHTTDIYSGMVRFDTSSGKQRSSSYMTFRMMGEWSDGWVIPPRPGLHLAKGVAMRHSEVFQEIVAQAFVHPTS